MATPTLTSHAGHSSEEILEQRERIASESVKHTAESGESSAGLMFTTIN